MIVAAVGTASAATDSGFSFWEWLISLFGGNNITGEATGGEGVVAMDVCDPESPSPMNGSGSSGDPYQVTDCCQLQDIESHLDSYYILVNDINCSDTVNWNNGTGFDPLYTSPYCYGPSGCENYYEMTQCMDAGVCEGPSGCELFDSVMCTDPMMGGICSGDPGCES